MVKNKQRKAVQSDMRCRVHSPGAGRAAQEWHSEEGTLEVTEEALAIFRKGKYTWLKAGICSEESGKAREQSVRGRVVGDNVRRKDQDRWGNDAEDGSTGGMCGGLMIWFTFSNDCSAVWRTTVKGGKTESRRWVWRLFYLSARDDVMVESSPTRAVFWRESP